jgi:hypothetical protein
VIALMPVRSAVIVILSYYRMICSGRWQSKITDFLDYGQASSYSFIFLSRHSQKRENLKRFALEPESRARAAELMENAKKTHAKMQALNRASRTNGKGLDKAVLDKALDDLIETFKDVNKKLDDLLAKAKE